MKMPKGEFARRLGVKATRISNYLKGERLKLERLGHIAIALECSLDYLLGITARPDERVAEKSVDYESPELKELIRGIESVNRESRDIIINALLITVRAVMKIESSKFERETVGDAARNLPNVDVLNMPELEGDIAKTRKSRKGGRETSK